MHAIKKIVGPTIENPPKPVIKWIPGLSNNKTVDKNEITNNGILQRRKL